MDDSLTEAVSEEGTAVPRAGMWASALATFFGIGLLKPGPGTWASAVTTLLWGTLASYAPGGSRTPLALAVAALATAVGIPAATRVARASKTKDPSKVVIDEVAGQMIALIGSPLRWQTLLVGLILFRMFDITKPFPVRRLEHLPEGIGIVLDDLGAGIYALLALQLLLHFGLLNF